MEVSQKIVDYAIWYYLKYYPSKKALENKLFEKFWPNSEKAKIYWWIWQETVDEILNQKMASIISEEEVARAKIKNYVEKNKNVSYIKSKMFQKKFEKELVLEILEKEFDFENNSLLSESKLRNQILALKQNWKSKNYIRRKFLERKQDKELIEWILEDIFKDWEFENILKESEKMKQKWFDKQKIFQKLFAKGFSYDDIKQVMKD